MARILLEQGTATKIHEWLNKQSGFLVINGVPGSGKTYLCWAIFNYLQDPRKTKRLWKEEDFFKRVRGSMSGSGDYSETISSMCDDFFMIYDDLGSMGINDWRREVVMTMIDQRYSSKCPTVITTNLDLHQIREKYDERIYDRLTAKENLLIRLPNSSLRQQGY